MGNTTSLHWKLDEHKDLPSSWADIEAIIAKGSTEPESPEWKRFAEMKTLDLHDNALVSVPPVIGRLASLTSLVLHSNRLESLPIEVLELQNLNSLDVHNNQIRTLPEGLSVLISLKDVDVSFNRLASLPVDFPVVVARLETLYLSHNPFDEDLPLKSALEKADLSAYRRHLGGNEDDAEKKPTKIETKPSITNVDLNAIARASGTTLSQSPRIAHKRRPPSKAHMEAQKIQAEEFREALSIQPDDDDDGEENEEEEKQKKASEGPIVYESAPSLGPALATDHVPANPMAAVGLADIMKSGIGGLKLRKAGLSGSTGKSAEGLDQTSSGPPIAQNAGISGAQHLSVSAGSLGSLRRVSAKEESTGDDRKEKQQEQGKEKEKEKDSEKKETNAQKENEEKERKLGVTEPGKEKEKEKPIAKWKQKIASPAPSDAGSGATAQTSAPNAAPTKSRPISLIGEVGSRKSPSTASPPTGRPYRSNSGNSQDISAKKEKEKDVTTNAKPEVDGSIPPWKRELLERKMKAAAQK